MIIITIVYLANKDTPTEQSPSQKLALFIPIMSALHWHQALTQNYVSIIYMSLVIIVHVCRIIGYVSPSTGTYSQD